jgi:hypothetical protein
MDDKAALHNSGGPLPGPLNREQQGILCCFYGKKVRVWRRRVTLVVKGYRIAYAAIRSSYFGLMHTH